MALCPLSIVADDIGAGRLVQLSDRAVRHEYAYHLMWKQVPDPASPGRWLPSAIG